MARNQRRDSLQSPRDVPSGRMGDMRRSVQQLFTGQSTVGGSGSRKTTKAARHQLAPRGMSSMGGTVPRLSRVRTAPAILNTTGTVISSHNHSLAGTPITSRPITPDSLQRTISLPRPVARRSTLPFVGVDSEEQLLADLPSSGGRRHTRRTRNSSKERSCRLNLADKRTRSRFIACCLSALMLLIILTIYLSLALSDREESQEFHVLLILIILVTTIFFCHSLISLCIVAIRTMGNEERLRISLIGPGGFANPPRPIRVAMARDEEAAGIESEATKTPPPAYGLWRESVRVDPDRIFWQRTEHQRIDGDPNRVRNVNMEGHVAARPPSYVSDDGVDYVVEARGRSIAPTANALSRA